jgi:hypothetical protein
LLRICKKCVNELGLGGEVFRGYHVLAVVAIVLAAVAVRATEFYATRYQSLPVVDWLESRPPLAQSASLPSADDLARGISRAAPLLQVRSDARPTLPVFGPPVVVQRTMGGVRDASRVELSSLGSSDPAQAPVQVRLDVTVFNRLDRAAAWSDLMAGEMDARDPGTGLTQARLSGPDESDGVWGVQPRQAGGIATVVGHRGAVAFFLQVTLAGGDKADAATRTELTARAEALARQLAGDWTTWLEASVAPRR